MRSMSVVDIKDNNNVILISRKDKEITATLNINEIWFMKVTYIVSINVEGEDSYGIIKHDIKNDSKMTKSFSGFNSMEDEIEVADLYYITKMLELIMNKGDLIANNTQLRMDIPINQMYRNIFFIYGEEAIADAIEKVVSEINNITDIELSEFELNEEEDEEEEVDYSLTDEHIEENNEKEEVVEEIIEPNENNSLEEYESAVVQEKPVLPVNFNLAKQSLSLLVHKIFNINDLIIYIESNPTLSSLEKDKNWLELIVTAISDYDILSNLILCTNEDVRPAFTELVQDMSIVGILHELFINHRFKEAIMDLENGAEFIDVIIDVSRNLTVHDLLERILTHKTVVDLAEIAKIHKLISAVLTTVKSIEPKIIVDADRWKLLADTLTPLGKLEYQVSKTGDSVIGTNTAKSITIKLNKDCNKIVYELNKKDNNYTDKVKKLHFNPNNPDIKATKSILRVSQLMCKFKGQEEYFFI